MSPAPEQLARIQIDAALEAAGWADGVNVDFEVYTIRTKITPRRP